MSAVQRIVFVPYVWQQRGRKKVLETGSPTQCKNEADGLRRIEKVKAGAMSIAGARVVKMFVDENAGDYGEPEFIAEAGSVPPLSED